MLGQDDNEELKALETTLTTNDDSNLQSIISETVAPVELVTGEDGTVYQVAGKNEQGQTILIPQGSTGTQQCVYLSNEQPMADLHAEAAANMLTLDPSATESYNDEQMITDQVE